MVNIYAYVTIHVYDTIHQVMNTYLFMRTVHLPVQLLFMCTALLTNTVLLHNQGTPSPYLHVKDQGSSDPISYLQIQYRRDCQLSYHYHHQGSFKS